jgi:hypothetical protein
VRKVLFSARFFKSESSLSCLPRKVVKCPVVFGALFIMALYKSDGETFFLVSFEMAELQKNRQINAIIEILSVNDLVFIMLLVLRLINFCVPENSI